MRTLKMKYLVLFGLAGGLARAWVAHSSERRKLAATTENPFPKSKPTRVPTDTDATPGG